MSFARRFGARVLAKHLVQEEERAETAEEKDGDGEVELLLHGAMKRGRPGSHQARRAGPLIQTGRGSWVQRGAALG